MSYQVRAIVTAVALAGVALVGLAVPAARAAQPTTPVVAPTLPTPDVAAKSVQDWFDHAVTDILAGVSQGIPDAQPKPADHPRSH